MAELERYSLADLQEAVRQTWEAYETQPSPELLERLVALQRERDQLTGVIVLEDETAESSGDA